MTDCSFLIKFINIAFLTGISINQSGAQQYVKLHASDSLTTSSTPIIDKNHQSANWQDFLPVNNKLDTMVMGDLNKDGLKDVVLIYQPKKASEAIKNDSRTLRILFQQKNGAYRLAAESPSAIAAEEEYNAFFSSIAVVKGILIIGHQYIRGGCTHRYRYQQGGFYLIGVNTVNLDPKLKSAVDFNLSTGLEITTTQNYEHDDDPPKTTRRKIKKISPLPNIMDKYLFLP